MPRHPRRARFNAMTVARVAPSVARSTAMLEPRFGSPGAAVALRALSAEAQTWAEVMRRGESARARVKIVQYVSM